MKRFFNFLGLIIMFIVPSPLSSNAPVIQQPLKTIFADKNNQDLYWDALLQCAHGNKDEALKIVSTLGSSTSAACTSAWKESKPPIDAFFDKLFLTLMWSDPHYLSQLGLFESIGITEHNTLLTDFSPAAIRQRFDQTKENIRQLQQYALDHLPADKKISYAVFCGRSIMPLLEKSFYFMSIKLIRCLAFFTILPPFLRKIIP